jgi:hypothetical protein
MTEHPSGVLRRFYAVLYITAASGCRIASVFDRYLKAPSTRFEEMDIQQVQLILLDQDVTISVFR